MDKLPLQLHKKQTQVSSPISSQFAKRPDSDVTWHSCYGSSCVRDCQKIMRLNNLTEWYYLHANFGKTATTWFQEWNISA